MIVVNNCVYMLSDVVLLGDADLYIKSEKLLVNGNVDTVSFI